MKIKKILVTGSTGFIGSKVLIYLLKKKFIVTDLVRRNTSELTYLRKNYNKNYSSIKISKNFEKKLKLKKFDCFIHVATMYQKNYKINEIDNLLKSNIYFPFSILNKIYHKKLMFINFGTMMEYEKYNKFPKKINKIPQNIYAISKIFFEEASYLFNIKKQFNLKIYETFDLNDTRKKIIPAIIDSIKNKKIIKIEKDLNLNFISIENIINTLDKIFKSKLKPGSYILNNKNFTNILKLIKKINHQKKGLIKYKVFSKFNKISPLKKMNFDLDVYKKLENYLND